MPNLSASSGLMGKKALRRTGVRESSLFGSTERPLRPARRNGLVLKFNFYLRVFALRNFRPETVRELRGLLGELRSSVSGPVCGR